MSGAVEIERLGRLLAVVMTFAACAGCGRPPDNAADPKGSAVPRGAVAPRDGPTSAPPAEIDERIAEVPSAPATEAFDPEGVGPIVGCVVCHGQNGEGKEALQTPRIGGLRASYLVRQLHYFRTGARAATDADEHGTLMRAIALTLPGDEAAADLAAYFATLEPSHAPATVEGDTERGEQLYAVCAACHGMDARGSEELNTPSLVGQHGWYLVRQLENFRDGVRGTQAGDVYGMQMTPIVQSTLKSDEDIADVVAFIQALPSALGGSAQEGSDAPWRGAPTAATAERGDSLIRR